MKKLTFYLVLFLCVSLLGMDNLKETEKFSDYRELRQYDYPAWMKDYLDYQKDYLGWNERMYRDIALHVNWLLNTTVEAHTSDDTLTEGETRSVHTNQGATGTITLTLPSVSYAGVEFTFSVQATQELRVDPGTATIRDDSGQTADKYITANAIGECLSLISNDDGDWITIAKYGTWQEEL